MKTKFKFKFKPGDLANCTYKPWFGRCKILVRISRVPRKHMLEPRSLIGPWYLIDSDDAEHGRTVHFITELHLEKIV